jgi:intraflagellar transport protein 74
MQKNLARQNKLPSQMQVDELKKDLNFKQRQLNDAESTAAKLAVEVEARQADLEKIKSLEGRIDTEMATVADGINKMEDDMANKFCRVDDLRANFEREKARISVVKQLVAKYKNALKQQTTNHSMKHDT